jgi:hypothetical protein
MNVVEGASFSEEKEKWLLYDWISAHRTAAVMNNIWIHT